MLEADQAGVEEAGAGEGFLEGGFIERQYFVQVECLPARLESGLAG